MAKIIKLIDICRTCAKTSKHEELIPLFPNGAINDIKKYLNPKFQVSKDDGLPQQICGECLDQFNDMNEFIQKCELKQLVLEKKFNIVKHLELQNSNVSTNNETNTYNIIKTESNTEYNDNNVTVNENNKVDDNYIIEEIDVYRYEAIKEDLKIELLTDEKSMEIENKDEESNTNIYDEIKDDDSNTTNTYEQVNDDVEVDDVDEDDNNSNHNSKMVLYDDLDIAKELEKAIKLAHQNDKKDFNSMNLDKLKYGNNSDDDDDDEDFENIYGNLKNNDFSNDFSCDLCPEKNMTFNQLQEHVKYQHKKKAKPKSVMCDMCGEVVKDVRLKAHMNDHLGIPNETKDCEICGRIGLTKEQYRAHVYKHGKPSHYCEHCNKGFRTLRNLEMHYKMNPDKKCLELKKRNKSNGPKASLQCLYCQKKFLTAVSLVKHCRTHSKPDMKDAKHICNYCGTAFKRADHLKIHLNSQHLKTEEFKCQICDKICYASFRLNLHMRTKHLNIPPRPKCEYCNKTFSNPQCVRRHQLEKHSETNFYKCPICGEQYSKTSELKHHAKIHNSLITNEEQKEIILKEFCPNVLDNSCKRKSTKANTEEQIEIEEVDEMENYAIYEME